MSGDRRAAIHRALNRNEKMTAYLEEHRETLLLGVVLGKFAEAVVESRAFS